MDRIRVIKVGGSLFELPDLRDRIEGWLAEQKTATNVLIAGGGRLVEHLRQLDRVHALGDNASHWLAISAMRCTAQFLAELFAKSKKLRATLIDDLPTILETGTSSDVGSVWVFDPEKWMRSVESKVPGCTLPASWDVTSDSISARVAVGLNAEELVLVKSKVPTETTLAQASAEGFVDAFFETAVSGIPSIRCVNLRTFHEVALSRDSTCRFM